MSSYWFRRRWGRYYPCSAEGWLLTAIALAMSLAGVAVILATDASRSGVITGILLIFVPIIPFSVIVLKRAEPRDR
ncbi:hypothetical protein GCM10027613_43490 [Microlunatus endophyticus]|nr:hypothetical protein [Microlunatus endophyticus]